jgi:hypothetical protein
MSTTIVEGRTMLFSPFYERPMFAYEVVIGVTLHDPASDIMLYNVTIKKIIGRNPTGRPRHRLRENVLARSDELAFLLRTIEEVEEFLAT